MSGGASGPLSGAGLAGWVDALARFTDEPGVLTRPTLGPAHKEAADCVAGWMEAAGLAVRVDAAGNVVGRLEAGGELLRRLPGRPTTLTRSASQSRPLPSRERGIAGVAAGDPHPDRRALRPGDSASPQGGGYALTLMIGSHIDTVPHGGRFDGNLGVILGIAVVEELRRRGVRLKAALEVIAFADEEGIRFPSTLSGARAVAGCFDPAALEEQDSEGVTRAEALVAFGGDPDAIPAEARDPGACLGYLEAHIEQGPVLEAAGLPLGVVTAISGATRGRVTVTGHSGHAGTLPMRMRQDALAAAAEMIVAVEKLARRATDLVATVGQVKVAGSAANKVAGRARFTLDVRSPSDLLRQGAVHDIEEELARIAKRRGVTACFEWTHDMPAAPCDSRLAQAVGDAIARDGHQVMELASGAGHDAMAFRGRIPMAMLFVRCRGGISHHPAEHVSNEDMEAAARVLFDAVVSLAGVEGAP